MPAINYRRQIRAAIRGLWSAVFDVPQFADAMATTIRNNLTVAWNEGAAKCGVGSEELTPEEHQELLSAILNETTRIGDLAAFVEANSKATGGKLRTCFARSELWINRYRDIVNRAQAISCADKKLAWRLGPTKDHCIDCSRLSGKIKRASQWERANIRPQSPLLACGGWRCLCTFEVTDEPMSRGPLPRLVGP